MFDKEKVKLGIAPIAWTNDDLPDLGKENTFEPGPPSKVTVSRESRTHRYSAINM